MKKLLLSILFLGLVFSFSAQKNQAIFALGKTFKVKWTEEDMKFTSGPAAILNKEFADVFDTISYTGTVFGYMSDFIVIVKYKNKIGALRIIHDTLAKVTWPFEYSKCHATGSIFRPPFYVQKGGMWGIINDTGLIIVPISHAKKPFANKPLFAVKSGARYTVYTASGNKMKFTVSDTAQLEIRPHNLFVLRDEKNNKHVFNGDLLPLFSDSIVKVRANEHFIRVDLLNSTSAVVSIKTGKRFYNVTEADEITNIYPYPRHFMNERFDEEMAMMESSPESEYKVLQNNKGKKALLDTAWNLVAKFEYDSIVRLYYRADSIKYLHLIAIMKNKKFAIYELPAFKQITRHQYDDIKLNEKSCWLKKNGHWEVYKIEDYKRLNGWAIDRGNPYFVFDSIKNNANGEPIFMKENKFGLNSFDCNVVAQPIYDSIKMEVYSGSYLLFQEGKMFVCRETGKNVAGPYTKATGIYNNNYRTFLVIKSGNKTGLLNDKNEIICEPIYDSIYYSEVSKSWPAKKGKTFDIIFPEAKKVIATNYIGLTRDTVSSCRSGWKGYLAMDTLRIKYWVDSVGKERFCKTDLFFVPEGKNIMLKKKFSENPVLDIEFDKLSTHDSLKCWLGWRKDKLYIIQSDLNYEIYTGMGKIQFDDKSNVFFEAYRDELVFILDKNGIVVKQTKK